MRFGDWLWHILHGDLGTSIFTNLPVTHMIAQRIEPTLSLMVLTLVFSIVHRGAAGRAGGLEAGHLDRPAVDGRWRCSASPCRSSWSATCWPTSSRCSSIGCRCRASRSITDGLWPFLRNLILPTSRWALIYIALIARITRATMLDVLSQDYVRTAKAKGVGQRPMLFVHALKNAAVPIVTVIGIGVALLIGGAVVTESVFAIPGLGRLTVDAILRRDYPVIQGVVLLFSVVYVLVNLRRRPALHRVRPEDPLLSATIEAPVAASAAAHVTPRRRSCPTCCRRCRQRGRVDELRPPLPDHRRRRDRWSLIMS